MCGGGGWGYVLKSVVDQYLTVKKILNLVISGLTKNFVLIFSSFSGD